MRDFLNIGSSPCDEDCVQVGHPDYKAKSTRELVAFKHQLERTFPDGTFTIKWFPHDFGMYGEVVAMFDTTSELPELVLEREAAFKAEREMPEHWDAQAREELGL